ncbi:MAG: lysylphosphatidylglycerol synthase transmembrane domain-containing protein [Acidobacteria bacterium]|nr:lysylphosphatidylglycerol synthase transmembrane domain-containing protein [Acidobacteriota bacterium]
MPGSRRWVRPALSAVLVAAAVAFLARTAGDVGWRVLGDRLAGADRTLLLLVLLVTLVRYAVWCIRWQVLVRPVEPIPWWPAQKALLASLFITTVVPASRPFGGLVRARYLAHELGRPRGSLYGGALVDQIGYTVVCLALGAIYLPLAFWVDPERSPADLLLLGLAGGAGLGLVFVVMWRRRSSLLARMRSRMPRVAEALEGTVDAAQRLLAHPATWRVVAVGGGAVWLANVLTFQIAAAALGYPLGFPAAAAAFALGSFVGTMTGTPGGAGTTELAAIVPLVALGVPTEVALPAVLLARGVHYICSILLGGIATIFRHRRDLSPLAAGKVEG